MSSDAFPIPSRDAAIALVRQLRRLGDAIGVKHSGIALDVGLLLYESGEAGLSVHQISRQTGYSGPTVRLVLARLTQARALGPAGRQGKTQFYRLTPRGMAGFDAYVAAILAFAEGAAFNGAGAPAPFPDPRSNPLHPRDQHAGAPPAPSGRA